MEKSSSRRLPELGPWPPLFGWGPSPRRTKEVIEAWKFWPISLGWYRRLGRLEPSCRQRKFGSLWALSSGEVENLRVRRGETTGDTVGNRAKRALKERRVATDDTVAGGVWNPGD